MASLDKSKPYGTISGHDTLGFEQGGRYFDFKGEEVAVPGAKAVAKNAEPKPEDVKKNAPAPSAVDEQLAKQ